MRRDSLPTRNKLIEAAERLYAELRLDRARKLVRAHRMSRLFRELAAVAGPRAQAAKMMMVDCMLF
jgi:hypothetical protein